MTCSVIILNWNGAKVLPEFLPTVLENTTLPDTEVVVVDNGSTDESIAYLQSVLSTPIAKAAHLHVIAYSENYGFAEGYNKAISEINSTYVVLLNSDVATFDDWLSPLLSYMQTHPEVVAAQPKILSYRSWLANKAQGDGNTAKSSLPITFEHAGAAGGFIDRLAYPFCRGRLLGSVEQDHGQYDTTIPVFWTTGAAMCVRREIYLQAGGLDAQFFAHMEEIDLCWRLNSRGYTLVCVPQSKVYHLGGGALAYDNPRKTYLNFRNNLLMIYKNAPTMQMIRLLVERFFLDYLAAAQMFVTRQPEHAKQVCRARLDFLRMRRQFKEKRAANKRLTTVPHPATISRRSVIIDYYLLRKR